MKFSIIATDLDHADQVKRLNLENAAAKRQAEILGNRVKELQNEVAQLNRELDIAFVVVPLDDDDRPDYIGYMPGTTRCVGFRSYRHQELIRQRVEPIRDVEPEF